MGVNNLWNILRPYSKRESLRKLAFDAFSENSNGQRGLRLGIDASLWMKHAQTVVGGVNPGLRTIFFRLAMLLSIGVIPIFVYDGPYRPSIKRGKKVYQNNANSINSKLVKQLTKTLTAFGFESRQAPGEAEAELAHLSQLGQIDAILTDDSDTFVFGATTVIRNWSVFLTGHAPNVNTSTNNNNNSPHKGGGVGVGEDGGDENEEIEADDPEHSLAAANSDKFIQIYHFKDLPVDRKALILAALLSGGDYHMEGLPGVGKAISEKLCTSSDIASKMYNIIEKYRRSDGSLDTGNENLQEELTKWREELKYILSKNPNNVLSRRAPSLASKIDTEPICLPDLSVYDRYASPVISKTYQPDNPKNNKSSCSSSSSWSLSSSYIITKQRKPDVPLLVEIMQDFFEWTHREVLQKFRTILYQGLILNQLRHATLELDLQGGLKRAEILQSCLLSPSSISSQNSRQSPLQMPSSSLSSTTPHNNPSKQISSQKSSAGHNLHSFFNTTKPTQQQKQRKKVPKSKKSTTPPSLGKPILEFPNSNSQSQPVSSGIEKWKFAGIRSSRNHWTTGCTLEYRVEIFPSGYVEDIKQNLWPNDPNIDKIRERKKREDEERVLEIFKQEYPDKAWYLMNVSARNRLEEDEDWLALVRRLKEEADLKKRKRVFVDPYSILRLWLPASAIAMVYPDEIEKFNKSKESTTNKRSRRKTPTSTPPRTPLSVSKKNMRQSTLLHSGSLSVNNSPTKQARGRNFMESPNLSRISQLSEEEREEEDDNSNNNDDDNDDKKDDDEERGEVGEGLLDSSINSLKPRRKAGKSFDIDEMPPVANKNLAKSKNSNIPDTPSARKIAKNSEMLTNWNGIDAADDGDGDYDGGESNEDELPSLLDLFPVKTKQLKNQQQQQQQQLESTLMENTGDDGDDNVYNFSPIPLSAVEDPSSEMNDGKQIVDGNDCDKEDSYSYEELTDLSRIFENTTSKRKSSRTQSHSSTQNRRREDVVDKKEQGKRKGKVKNNKGKRINNRAVDDDDQSVINLSSTPVRVQSDSIIDLVSD